MFGSLVDAGYACCTGFLPPYGGVRYHLSEYGSRNYPTNAKELFSLRHSSLRVTVERAFGALKNRFRRLDNIPFHTYKTQVKVVLACCILHNWILGFGKDQVVSAEDNFEGSLPEAHDTQPLGDMLSQDSTGMALRRYGICIAM